MRDDVVEVSKSKRSCVLEVPDVDFIRSRRIVLALF